MGEALMQQLAYVGYGLYLVLIIAGGLAAVLSTSLVRALMGLILSLFGVAGMFLLMNAPFLAFMQVLIYVGAVSVLIFFAIMLTKTPEGEAGAENVKEWIGLRAGLAVLAALTPAIIMATLIVKKAPEALALKPEVTLAQMGQFLTGPFVLAFELISVVLLAAMAGAVVLGFERRKGK
ncbi:MAG: NADH-quinone oxidoreductase subunit J [Pseudomonadota bacterium]